MQYCVVCSFNRVLFCATPWILAHHAPLSVEILQARIMEWVAISSSRGTSPPRDGTHISCVSCIGRQIPYPCATWEALSVVYLTLDRPFHLLSVLSLHPPKGSVVKNPLANAGDTGDVGSVPGSGRSPRAGNGNPLTYSSVLNNLFVKIIISSRAR